MRLHILTLFYSPLSFRFLTAASASPVTQAPLTGSLLSSANYSISEELFTNLEELSRIVDISYCVGTTGIQKPFLCASRCSDFKGFELVTVGNLLVHIEREWKLIAVLQTWETGPLLSDSCGYVAIDHAPANPRIILAFRGTYSLANAIVDLSTIPQEYVPYPGDEAESKTDGLAGIIQNPRKILSRALDPEESRCENCTVHAGFMASWRHTRPYVLPHIEKLVQKYPDYHLTLVGHSLGGAVAALAGLDFQARGWKPQVTTFGEPRMGNNHLMHYLDIAFALKTSNNGSGMYRRVTHVDDPVPLLPLSEWGYQMHAGEIYIKKPDLSPNVSDLRYCDGDADPACIAGAEAVAKLDLADVELRRGAKSLKDWLEKSKDSLSVPARFRIWQLFFAHRDYFWRLGICLPKADGWEE